MLPNKLHSQSNTTKMSTTRTLHIKPTDSSMIYYENHKTYHIGDAGLDLFIIDDVTIKPNTVSFIDLQISCQMIEQRQHQLDRRVSYFLFPRSSISKTPLQLANSVAIIDSDYTGNLIIALRNTATEHYTIKAGQRIVQLCSRDLDTFDIKIVKTLDVTERGDGGFGSTGL